MNHLFLKDKLENESDGLKKARDILWLPITSGIHENYSTILEHRLDLYYKLLSQHIASIFCDLYKNRMNYSSEKVLYLTKILIDGIKNCHKHYLCGDIHKAHSDLFSVLDTINDVLKSYCVKYSSSHIFWRIRKGKSSNVTLSDLYHIPFDKAHLCKDERFNTKGYPCLYLSFEKDGCKKEMCYSSTEDSLASFQQKNDSVFEVLDLTKVNDSSYANDEANIIAHIIWPLLAACYGISKFCKDNNTECSIVNKKFKIEYVIPQILAEYVHNHMKLDGIVYYTVRNENLDPSTSDMKNIILFTSFGIDSKYDMNLLNKFNINLSN